jgi:hypothetical protein
LLRVRACRLSLVLQQFETAVPAKAVSNEDLDLLFIGTSMLRVNVRASHICCAVVRLVC